MIATERKKDMTAIAILLIIAGVYFWPILFGDSTIFFRDVTGLLYPLYRYLAQSLHEGVYPFWNPMLFNGAPLFAALCPGIFYPPVLMFLLDDFTFAYNLFNFSHYAFFAISTYALSRHLGVSACAALCSAITALLGGFFLASIYFFLQIIWMPIIFLCFRKFAFENKIMYIPLTALCITMQLLCGPPESCFITLLLVYSHTLVMRAKGEWLERTLQLGLIVVMAVGMAAPQWLSTMILLKETVRSGGLDFEHHTRWSLEPETLATIFSPKDHGRFMERVPWEQFGFFQSFHMGVFAALFLIAGCLFWQRKEIRYWSVVFILGIFFALGKYNPVYEFIYNGLPLLRFFRYPEKFFIFSAFAQIFLVGFVADGILQKSANMPRFFVACAMVCGLVLGTSYLVPESKPLVSIVCLVIFGICAYAYYLRRITNTAFKALLLFLLVFDLSSKHSMLVPMVDRKFFEAEPAVVIQIKQDGEGYRAYAGSIQDKQDHILRPPGTESYFMFQVLAKERLYPSWGVNFGIPSPYGIAGMGMELNDIELWGSIFEKSSPEKRARILERGNVKYWIDGDEVSIEGKVHILNDALPRAYLVPKSRQGQDLKLLNTYYDENFDPRAEVLLSEAVDVKEVADFSGQVEDAHYEANRIVIHSRQNGEGFLVVLDSWFPGWTATVDGKPQNIYRANHFYRAVKLEPGNHTVEFSFEPPGFRTGLWICFATISLMIIGLMLIRRPCKTT